MTQSPGSSTSKVSAERQWYRRLAGRLPTVIGLTAIWVLLWGDPRPGTIIAGGVVAVLCYSVAKLPHIPVRLGFRPLYALRLAAHVGYDMLSSSIQVGFYGLWNPKHTRGAIVAIPARTDSDFLLAMLSGLVSLVTGSLVIELNRNQGVVYVHGLPANDLNAVKRLRTQVRRTEKLLVFAFGTAEDRKKFRAETEKGSPRNGEKR